MVTSKLLPFRLLLVVVVLAGLILHSSGQHERYQQIVQQYRKADQLYQKALQLAGSESYSESEEESLNARAQHEFRSLLSLLPAQGFDSIRFFACFKSGELAHYFDAPDTALQYYRQAISLKPRLPLADSFFFKPNLYAGIICYNKSQFDAARRYLQEADKIQSGYKQKLEEAERLYNNLGALLYETGNFVQAQNYFEKAASVLDRSHPFYQNLFVNYRINVAAIHIKLQQYEAARKIYLDLLPYGMHTNEILHNTGLSYLQSGDAAQALGYFRKLDYANRLQAGLYTDIARAFLQLRQPDSAQQYLQAALQTNEQHYGRLANTDRGLAYRYLGDLMLQQSGPLQALKYYQAALQQLYPRFRNNNIVSNPQQYSGVLSYIHLFHALTAKANALEQLHVQTGNREWLQAAANTYTSAFDLADYVATVYDNDEARLFLSEARFSIHSRPVLLALQLYQLTADKDFAAMAYEFDQRGKAAALTYRQQELLSKKDPLSVSREQQLKETVTRLSIAASRSTDSGQLATLGQSIRDAAIALGKLHDSAARTRELIPREVPKVSHLQRRLLDRHTAILSYNLSPGRMVCFSITANEFRVTQKTLPRSFQEQTKTIIQSFHQFAAAEEKELKQWYGLLIPDSLQHIKRWIVIPDGQLHYLPFEALIDEGGRYLVEKQSVQYQYTTALLQLEKKSFASATTLGMAPFANNQLAAKPMMLPRSAAELTPIKGQPYLDGKATKQRFLLALDQHEILHLATHARLNETDPRLSHILFSPMSDSSEPGSLLFLDEIKNLPLQQTRLVILSACETAGGSLLLGEGVMSISRAFAYAGCPNVVTSLWKAEDAATAYLTQRLHRYLQDGKTLDEALQDAKKDYLNDRSINPRMKSPAYWAHLVFIGDYQRERTDPVIWWITGVSALIFVVLAAIQFRKRQRRR